MTYLMAVREHVIYSYPALLEFLALTDATPPTMMIGSSLQRDASAWVEPMREWIKDAQTLDEIAKTNDLPSKKSYLCKIFGSNLTLQSREARGTPINAWYSLAQAKEKIGKIPTSLILEPMSGIEPETSPFVYTSPYGRTRLYLSRRYVGTLVSRSGVPMLHRNATVLSLNIVPGL